MGSPSLIGIVFFRLLRLFIRLPGPVLDSVIFLLDVLWSGFRRHMLVNPEQMSSSRRRRLKFCVDRQVEDCKIFFTLCLARFLGKLIDQTCFGLEKLLHDR